MDGILMMAGYMAGFGIMTFNHWLTWLIALPGSLFGAKWVWAPFAVGVAAAVAFQVIEDIPRGQGGDVMIMLIRFLPAFIISGTIVLTARLAARRMAK